MTNYSEQYPLGHEEINTVALVTNPKAGHGAASHAAERAMAQFSKRGIDVVALQGKSPADARRLIRTVLDDGRVDALVVAGGDGMINLALQEQAGTDIPLGIIPAGTGNDHGREYRLPRNSPEDAADVVADGFCITTDLGRISSLHDDDQEPMWFGTIMCAGFDSLVSDRVNEMSWPHGRNRYNAAIVIEFLNFHALPFKITLDDGRVIDERITLAAFGNTRSYGGGMKICPSANHSDGMMDITVIGKAGRIKAATVFGSVFKGEHVNYDEVQQYRCRSAVVEFLDPKAEMNAYADGDYMMPLPVKVEVVPHVGRYIVPRP
ncbi:diacylglycerol kinase [Corynebacterium sp. TAE3-ERU12]|uniref:diacylglycerol kinase n=1 Tax=Corynebacterium sp. TAE3-ERU12 TaxID=2849491 RepID=UPI001C445265|nr:diacylglycerol kinase [Corynebacterium sp. TAE3-ERU12]MBV7295756.1 diacylglycerol kinase [Corynebacterium sp. TAE3-ERU12]